MNLLFRSFLGACIGVVPVVSSLADDAGFTPLLDRAHTDGWRQCGNTEMRVKDGEATSWAPGGKARGVYWYTRRPFRDFVIRLEYSLDGPTSNSGVFVRFPELGDNPQVASDDGYEIQIYGGAEHRHPTGEIWGFQPPTSVPQKMGGWNEMEVTVIGQHYTVVLNGQKVNEFTGTRRLEGYIGLQDYPGAPVHLRNVRIKELAATADPGIAAVGEAPKGDGTCIGILSEQAPNALEWALAPLDQTLPPDIRRNLVLLRENLLDEGANKPAAGPAAYKEGQQLCNALIGILNEREQAVVRAGYRATQAEANIAVTNQALEARVRFMNWPKYFREKDQREELRREKENGAGLSKQKLVVEWSERGTVLRREMDALYAQFREAVREK